MVQVMTMPGRFRGSRMGTQIHSIKHVVDTSGGLTSTPSINVIATGVTTRNATFDPTEVEVGETVNGFFISIYIIGSTGSGLTGPLDWYIAKSRSGQVIATVFPDPGNTGVSSVRNQIFHEEKGLAGSEDGTPMVFKGVIVVPKGMRRMRDNDAFFISLKANGADIPNFCVKAIYKSFS